MSTKIIFAVLSIATIVYVVSFFIWAEPTDPETSGPEETVAGATTDEFQSAPIPGNTVRDITPPSNTPTDVPIYPDAYLNDTEEYEAEGIRDITLSFITEDTLEDVNAWYRSALTEDGWTIVGDETINGYPFIEAQREDLKTFMQATPHTTEGEVTITQLIRIEAQ